MIDKLGQTCRTVAVAVIAGVWRRESIEEVQARILALPPREQALVTAGVLGALFLLSLIAAQFGWVAMMAYWLVVILVVN